MNDKYYKVVLTAIALFLLLIVLKLYEPREAKASLYSSAPTVGELWDLNNIKDNERSMMASKNLIRRIPLVRVHGIMGR